MDDLPRAVVLCNDARLVPPSEAHRPWTVIGDPTEGALLAAGGRAGVDRHEVRNAGPRTAQEPFDAGRARMTTRHRASRTTAVTGAPTGASPTARRPPLTEDDVIAFGPAIERSLDVVGAARAEPRPSG